MRKLLVTLLYCIPMVVFSQYVKISTHYDAETTAHKIIHGHVEDFLSDSVTYIFEKRTDKFVTKNNRKPDYIKCRLDKTFSKGRVEYISRTNGGYTFTIAVVDMDDDTVVKNYCTFHIDGYTNKINEVEISKGE